MLRTLPGRTDLEWGRGVQNIDLTNPDIDFLIAGNTLQAPKENKAEVVALGIRLPDQPLTSLERHRLEHTGPRANPIDFEGALVGLEVSTVLAAESERGMRTGHTVLPVLEPVFFREIMSAEYSLYHIRFYPNFNLDSSFQQDRMSVLLCPTACGHAIH
ncbi:hypothetical protein Nans01_14350 [Nocardiopsis ansamitocini]|uniref:Uncharacterized protein n=1 Tax=Nocardiopsis ansamitocini TaxID=1670832 RepID=A0A9W6P4C1_9ACTN|nr:hypothetical protein Nans01_14350 [Nocardiopsis ansamitocini]